MASLAFRFYKNSLSAGLGELTTLPHDSLVGFGWKGGYPLPIPHPVNAFASSSRRPCRRGSERAHTGGENFVSWIRPDQLQSASAGPAVYINVPLIASTIYVSRVFSVQSPTYTSNFSI